MDNRSRFCCSYRTTLFAAILMLAGCGGVYDASVRGVVLLDGNAIETGTVSFLPTAGGPPAYGRIGAAGEYLLSTGRESGLPPGEYGVTVVANEPPTTRDTADGGPPAPGKPITPEWYRSADTSGLKFTVKPGSNNFTIELSSEPPAGWKPPKPVRGRR